MRALILEGGTIVSLALLFGARGWIHKKRTGTWGFLGFSGAAGSPGWWGGVLFSLAVGLLAVAPALAWAGVAPPLWAPRPALDILGATAAIAGLAATWWAQASMGSSWRVGVRESERTALVTAGLFRYVRNPIFSAMALAAAGVAVLLPNAPALAAAVVLIAAVEIQVRVVEEPYLRRTHGEAYDAYCARVGRFVPGVGRSGSIPSRG